MKSIKKVPLFAALCLFCFIGGGCATTSWKGVCRHEAIYAARVVGEIYKVRIAVGPSGPNTTHAQAQAFIDGKWEWLHAQGDSVYLSTQDAFFTPTIFLPVELFEKNMERITSSSAKFK